MCCMGMQGGAFALVHAVVLLTVSFFVLLAALKSDSKSLKTFGLVIAVLLWVSAALVFGKGMSGRNCMMDKMGMMAGKGCGSMMGGGMQQSDAPAPTK